MDRRLGTFFASPGVLSKRNGVKRLDPRKLISTPFWCNIISIDFLIAFMGCIFALTAPGGTKYRKAVQMWHRWDAMMKAQGPSARVTNDTLQGAHDLWKLYAEAWWWIALTFVIWTLWAVAFLVTIHALMLFGFSANQANRHGFAFLELCFYVTVGG